jgi:hypothetical protein
MMSSKLDLFQTALAYSWSHYWPRALLLVMAAALITLTAGLIARVFNAFRLDHDDVRREKADQPMPTSSGIEPDPFAWPSQEPDDVES